MPPLALFSGFGLLAVGLLVALADPTGSTPDLAGSLGLFAVWVLFLAFVAFFASRLLVAGSGWLAAKRGFRWHVVHAEDLRDAPAGNVLDTAFGQGHTLRLYSSDSRIDISQRQLACPEVHSAVEAFIRQASESLPGTSRTVALRMMEEVEPNPSNNLSTLARKVWVISGLLGAICLIEAILLLALSG